MTRAIFLDRDGVLNRSEVRNGKPYAPRRLEDFEILPDVPDACKKLVNAGYLLIVVTNQPDIGNGLVDPAVVDAMHKQLQKALPLTAIYTCPHKQTDGCTCRKPAPGLLLQAKTTHEIDMAQSYMVGDRKSDVEAALAVGVTPVFIDYKYIETGEIGATVRVANLAEAASYILTHAGRSTE